MTGRGGWPMSVFLTPELQPFYGGTYCPPTQRMGMPGFDQMLSGRRRRLEEPPRSRRSKQAADLTRHLQQAAAAGRRGRAR